MHAPAAFAAFQPSVPPQSAFTPSVADVRTCGTSAVKYYERITTQYQHLRLAPFFTPSFTCQTQLTPSQRQRTPAAMLTSRLRAMFSRKGNGPWWLAVHLLEKGRQEGIKDVKVYNVVLKVKQPPASHPVPHPPPGQASCVVGHGACFGGVV